MKNGLQRPSTTRVQRAGILLGTLLLAALVNRQAARAAERRNPPRGRFVTIDGVRLHYIARGKGETLLLLHGNGSMIADFESSGIVEQAAKSHRVIVIDRPGFGHSGRPRNRTWTAEAQAELIQGFLKRLRITSVVVVGHSWGTLPALALAAGHPGSVKGLILVSGHYFPALRIDAMLASLPAVPLLGDVIRHTLAPITARLAWPLLLSIIFGPAPVPRSFRQFPKEMALRPSQIRASAEEAGLLDSSARNLLKSYSRLKMPVAIVAGDADRIVDTRDQSLRLHRLIAGSTLRVVKGAGHMVHQTSPQAVMLAIEAVSDGHSRNKREMLVR